MKDYFERLQEDHGRMVALQGMCEAVGRNNDAVVKWTSIQHSPAYDLAFAAMFFELILTVGRLFDSDEKRSASLYLFIKNEFKTDLTLIGFVPEFNRLDDIYRTKIYDLRNKVFAHKNKIIINLEVETADVYDFCDELTQFLYQLGGALNIQIHSDVDNYSYWRSEGEKFWQH